MDKHKQTFRSTKPHADAVLVNRLLASNDRDRADTFIINYPSQKQLIMRMAEYCEYYTEIDPLLYVLDRMCLDWFPIIFVHAHKLGMRALFDLALIERRKTGKLTVNDYEYNAIKKHGVPFTRDDINRVINTARSA